MEDISKEDKKELGKLTRVPTIDKARSFKKRLVDSMSDREVKSMVRQAKKIAKGGDKSMLKFLLEQVFGKSRQNVGLDGGAEGKPITMAALLDSLEKPKKAVKNDDGMYIVE